MLAACLLSPAATAQTADAPQIRVGDRWWFVEWYTVPSTTPNRDWTITSLDGTRILGTENGEPLVLTTDLNVSESPRSTASNPRDLDFPLTVGKRWQFDTDWTFKPKASKGRASISVVVAAYERVTVPAGTFDAYRIESRERHSGRSPIGSVYDAEVLRTYWYAPEASAIVKRVTKHPYLGPSTVELVALDLKR